MKKTFRCRSRIFPGMDPASQVESCQSSEVDLCEQRKLCVAGVHLRVLEAFRLHFNQFEIALCYYSLCNCKADVENVMT